MDGVYVTGDATQPQAAGRRIIVHVCNDVGKWGRGFVLALSQRWPEPEKRYRSWAEGEDSTPFELGAVQFVPVALDLWVANLLRAACCPSRRGHTADSLRGGTHRTGTGSHVRPRARGVGTHTAPRGGLGWWGLDDYRRHHPRGIERKKYSCCCLRSAKDRLTVRGSFVGQQIADLMVACAQERGRLGADEADVF